MRHASKHAPAALMHCPDFCAASRQCTADSTTASNKKLGDFVGIYERSGSTLCCMTEHCWSVASLSSRKVSMPYSVYHAICLYSMNSNDHYGYEDALSAKMMKFKDEEVGQINLTGADNLTVGFRFPDSVPRQKVWTGIALGCARCSWAQPWR